MTSSIEDGSVVLGGLASRVAATAAAADTVSMASSTNAGMEASGYTSESSVATTATTAETASFCNTSQRDIDLDEFVSGGAGTGGDSESGDDAGSGSGGVLDGRREKIRMFYAESGGGVGVGRGGGGSGGGMPDVIMKQSSIDGTVILDRSNANSTSGHTAADQLVPGGDADHLVCFGDTIDHTNSG